MMIRKISHVGIAVKDLAKAEKFYGEILGMNVTSRGSDEALKWVTFAAGESAIELLQSLAPDGLIAKFIQRNGEGIHHIAYEVENIEKTLAALRSKNVRLIDRRPRKGLHDSRLAFINPLSSLGVIIELVEHQK